MNNKAPTTIFIVTVASLLAASTAMAPGFLTTYKSLAYEGRHSQAGAPENVCGNGVEPLNVLCKNVASEIQGDQNAANILGAHAGGGRQIDAVGIMEFRDGKIAHEMHYYADPFEPPEWRSQWVERIQ